MSEASGGSAEIQWGGGGDFIGEKAGNEHATSALPSSVLPWLYLVSDVPSCLIINKTVDS